MDGAARLDAPASDIPAGSNGRERLAVPPPFTLADVRRVLSSQPGEPVTVGLAAEALDVEPRELVREILRQFGLTSGIYLLRNRRGRITSVRGEGGGR
jgi:hypothetical protein